MIKSSDGGAHWSRPGEHLPGVRHLQRVRAVDRPLRRGRRRRRAQRPLARAVGRHRQRRPDRRRRDEPDRHHAGSTVATGSTTSTSCSAARSTAATSWTPRRADRAARRSRVLLGAGDLARRHRRLARLQRLHGRRSGRARSERATTGSSSAWCCTRVTGAASARSREVAPRSDGRRARLVAERPRRGVPRRLRLRGGDATTTAPRVWNDVRDAARLRRHRPLPTGPARRGGRHRAADRRGRGAARRERRRSRRDHARTQPTRPPSSRCVRRTSATPTSSAGRACRPRSPRAADSGPNLPASPAS